MRGCAGDREVPAAPHCAALPSCRPQNRSMSVGSSDLLVDSADKMEIRFPFFSACDLIKGSGRNGCETIQPKAATAADRRGRIVVRAVFFSLLGPVVLSSLVPIYLAFNNAPYLTAVVWALACTLWWARRPFEAALNDTNWLQPSWYKSTLVAAVLAIFGFAFGLGDSLAYLLTRSISN